jgi:hypothetical protein
VLVSRAASRLQGWSPALKPPSSRHARQKEVHAASAVRPTCAGAVAVNEEAVSAAWASTTLVPENGFISVTGLRFGLHACPGSAAQPESAKCKPSSSRHPGFCQECGPTLRSRRPPTAWRTVCPGGLRIFPWSAGTPRCRGHLTSNVRPRNERSAVCSSSSNPFVALGSIVVGSAGTVENLRSYWSAKVARRTNAKARLGFGVSALA